MFHPHAHIVQPKLTIGQPNDSFKQEADAIADQVMKMSENQIPSIQRMNHIINFAQLPS